MEVLALFLIIVLIILAIIHWYVTVPLLAFLAYLACILNHTDAFTQPMKHPIRFHVLWWLFMITLTTGIIQREEISWFISDCEREYDKNNDPNPLEDMVLHSSDTPLLQPGNTPSPTKALYGKLKTGMSPLRITWMEEISSPEQFNQIKIDDITLGSPYRYYFDNELYTLEFSIHGDSTNHYNAQVLTRFLARKYGQPHHHTTTDTLYRAYWQFSDKNLLIEAKPDKYHCDFYVYDPALLRQLMDHRLQLERAEQQRLREKKLAEEAREREQLRQEEEARRAEEALNQQLQNNL